jgi:hypothetical protein
VDNFHFDVTCQGNEQFSKCLEMAITLSGHKNVTHYLIDDKRGLGLFWHYQDKHDTLLKLPYPMKIPAIVQFATNWISQVEYPQQPDHDGDNGRGWRIYNESWGHVWDYHEGVIAIAPVWAMYGK